VQSKHVQKEHPHKKKAQFLKSPWNTIFRRMGEIEKEWVKVLKKISIEVYDREFWSCGSIVVAKRLILKTKWYNCGKMICNLRVDKVKNMKCGNLR
jgi:hypothetical protein